jgi:hypothetical protein
MAPSCITGAVLSKSMEVNNRARALPMYGTTLQPHYVSALNLKRLLLLVDDMRLSVRKCR